MDAARTVWGLVPSLYQLNPFGGTEIILEEQDGYRELIDKEIISETDFHILQSETQKILVHYSKQVILLTEQGFFDKSTFNDYEPEILECYLKHPDDILAMLKGYESDLYDFWGNLVSTSSFPYFKMMPDDFPKSDVVDQVKYLFSKDEILGTAQIAVWFGAYFGKKYRRERDPLTWKQLFYQDIETLRMICTFHIPIDGFLYEGLLNYPILMKYISHWDWNALEKRKKELLIQNTEAIFKFVDKENRSNAYNVKKPRFEDPENHITFDVLLNLPLNQFENVMENYRAIHSYEQFVQAVENPEKRIKNEKPLVSISSKKAYLKLLIHKVVTEEGFLLFSEETQNLLIEFHEQAIDMIQEGFFKRDDFLHYDPKILAHYLIFSDYIIPLIKGLNQDVFDFWGNGLRISRMPTFQVTLDDFPKSDCYEQVATILRPSLIHYRTEFQIKDGGVPATLIGFAAYNAMRYRNDEDNLSWRDLFELDLETLQLMLYSRITEGTYEGALKYPILIKYLPHHEWMALEWEKRNLLLNSAEALLKYVDKLHGFEDPENQITLEFLLDLPIQDLETAMTQFHSIHSNKELLEMLKISF